MGAGGVLAIPPGVSEETSSHLLSLSGSAAEEILEINCWTRSATCRSPVDAETEPSKLQPKLAASEKH